MRRLNVIWLKRRFAGVDYVPYMYRLKDILFANTPLYAEFIMVSTNTADPGISDYYVGLPHEALSQAFEAFERIAEYDFSKKIDVLLIADAGKEPFQIRFGKRV